MKQLLLGLFLLVGAANPAAAVVANAGGPYLGLNAGDSLFLDATGTTFLGGEFPISYQWSINGAPSFSSGINPTPIVSWATLLTFGVTSDGVFPIGLGVSTNLGLDIASSSLTVNPVPEPTTMLLLAMGLGGAAFVRRKQGPALTPDSA